MGYSVAATLWTAAEVGAPHRRERLFILAADPDRLRELQPQGREQEFWRRIGNSGRWSTEPGVGRVAHGVADRVDRLRACGNGVVPEQAARAFVEMWEELT